MGNKCGSKINNVYTVLPTNIGDITISGTSGCTIIEEGLIRTSTGIEPGCAADDGQGYVGRKTKRFRELNTISGCVSVFSSTTITVTSIDLGFCDGEQRILTCETSILSGDTLNGGNY